MDRKYSHALTTDAPPRQFPKCPALSAASTVNFDGISLLVVKLGIALITIIKSRVDTKRIALFVCAELDSQICFN